MPRDEAQRTALLRHYLATFSTPAGQEVFTDLWTNAKAAVRQCPDDPIAQARVLGRLQQLLMIEDAMQAGRGPLAIDTTEVR